MSDDLDLVELERRLLSTLRSPLTPEGLQAFLANAQPLADKYGPERISAMVTELMSLRAGETSLWAEVICQALKDMQDRRDKIEE